MTIGLLLGNRILPGVRTIAVALQGEEAVA
jgi:hypothetical protein